MASQAILCPLTHGLLLQGSCVVGPTLAGQVVQMTGQNYNELTSKHELVFINFYADWCRFR